MPKILTEEQIANYHEHGFLSPIDVFSEAQALAYKEQLEAAERDHPEHIHAENRNNTHLSFKFLDEIAHHPVVLDVVEDLLGEHFSLWATVLFIKEPSTPHFVSWHQDATYMGLDKHT